MTNKKVLIETIYCGSWFNGLITQLQDYIVEKFGSDDIEFVNYPKKVEKDQPKPYTIKINGKIVYSINDPVNGEKVPIIFKENKYFGKPDKGRLENLDNIIINELNKKEEEKTCDQW